MIEHCFEDLAHALRINSEYLFRFQDLAQYDRDEAVGNLDNGFNSILNAFHSLYDARKSMGGRNWYSTDEFLTLVAIRNARHHNNANKIKQLFNVYWPTEPNTPQILLIAPEPDEPDASCHEYYLRLTDLDFLLKQTSKKNKLPADARQRIHSYLHWTEIEKIAEQNNISMENVFYNAIPLIVNAGIEIIGDISQFISGKSVESQTFKVIFETMKKSRMDSFSVSFVGGIPLEGNG